MLSIIIFFTLIKLCLSEQNPNIIFILLDDVGFNDLSITGSLINKTPNIDFMANNGILFQNYHSASSLCTPSRGSILTGKYFRKLGLYPGVLNPFSDGGLSPKHNTFVKELKKNKYSTALIGKWHLNINEPYHPLNHGFDFYYGMPMSHDQCRTINDYRQGGVKNSSLYGPCPIFENRKIIKQGNIDLDKLDNELDIILNKTISNLREPYFLMHTSHHAHTPQFPSNSFTKSIERADLTVGKILNQTKNTNTIIFLTSDNGASYMWDEYGGLNYPFRCCKGSTFDGGFRVPAILYGKNITKRRTKLFLTGLDLYSTFLSIANVSKDNHYDGYNFWENIKNNNETSPREIFYYLSGRIPQNISHRGSVMAVKKNGIKYNKYIAGGNCNKNYYDKTCYLNNILSKKQEYYYTNIDPSEKVSYKNESKVNYFNNLIENFINNFEDAESEILKGNKLTNFPCANKDCKNIPYCCKT